MKNTEEKTNIKEKLFDFPLLLFVSLIQITVLHSFFISFYFVLCKFFSFTKTLNYEIFSLFLPDLLTVVYIISFDFPSLFVFVWFSHV